MSVAVAELAGIPLFDGLDERDLEAARAGSTRAPQAKACA